MCLKVICVTNTSTISVLKSLSGINPTSIFKILVALLLTPQVISVTEELCKLRSIPLKRRYLIRLPPVCQNSLNKTPTHISEYASIINLHADVADT